MALETRADTVTVNGRTVTRTYDATTRTTTDTTPEGRQSRTVLDSAGRPALFQTGDLTPTELSYDPNGRIDGIARGARVTGMTYDPNTGDLESITDPLNRTVGFIYDDEGRVTTQTLPDGRQIGYGYDDDGNLTSITPPGRPVHDFIYSGTNQQRWYIPPQPDPAMPLPERRTKYAYNVDGQLTRITRPDGQAINFNYDVQTGQLLTQNIPTGQRRYQYDQETGNLHILTAPDGGTITYGYDGALPTGETWAGTVAGSVSRIYDSSFRVDSQSVNAAHTVNFTYDNDDLLTGAGAMTMSRDPVDGLLEATGIGAGTDSTSYDAFGDPNAYTATVNTTDVFDVRYVRDELGRIIEKVETIDDGTGPVTTSYVYDYDTAGRLSDVTRDGTPIAHYEYDSNGNRVPEGDGNPATSTFTEHGGGLLGASYDDQDRLEFYTTIGGGRVDYTYTANGELSSKTLASTGETTSYTYDVLGNLRDVTLPDGTLIESVIDGQNRRIGKKVDGTPVQGFL